MPCIDNQIVVLHLATTNNIVLHTMEKGSIEDNNLETIVSSPGEWYLNSISTLSLKLLPLRPS
jgi:hypothetical protein